MNEEADFGELQQGEEIENLGTLEIQGKTLHVSRWKWHGTRGEQLIFSEKQGFVPKGTWRWASVKYRLVEDNNLVFSGISVPETLRGAGTDFFNFFLRDCKAKGKKLVGSDVIRKPIVAQMLLRAGWKPESTAYMAEILPRSKYEESGIPKVHAVDSNIPSSAKWKDFYSLEDAAEVQRKYPSTDPSISNVALFTRYLPPETD
jgi:hypothetical protein